MKRLAMILLLAGASCGQAPPCTSATCLDGCCSVDGLCVRERNETQCGAPGAICLACASGQVCGQSGCEFGGFGGSGAGGASGGGGGLAGGGGVGGGGVGGGGGAAGGNIAGGNIAGGNVAGGNVAGSGGGAAGGGSAGGVALLPDGGVCLRKSCLELAKNCGAVADGCGGTVQCGTCPSGACGNGGTPNVCGSPPVVFDFGLTTYPVSGTVTWNGANPPPRCTGTSAGTLEFRDNLRDLLLTVDVPCPAAGGPLAFRADLYPGTYSVVTDSVVLGTREFVATPSFVVSGPRTGVVLDVRTHRTSLALRVNGSTPPCSMWGDMVLTSRGQSPVSVILSRPCSWTSWLEEHVGEGQYSVRSTNGFGHTFGVGHTFVQPLSVTGSSFTLLEYSTVLVSGVVSVNIPFKCTTAANVIFRGASEQRILTVPCPTGGATTLPFSLTLSPDTYEVTISTTDLRNALVTNSLVIAAATSGLVLPITLYPVTGTVVFGAGGDDPCLDRTIWFETPGRPVVITEATCAGVQPSSVMAFSTQMPAATYRAQLNGGFQCADRTLEEVLTISSARQLTYRLAAYPISGTMTANGAPMGCNTSTALFRSAAEYDSPICRPPEDGGVTASYRGVSCEGTYRLIRGTAGSSPYVKNGVTVSAATPVVPVDFITHPVRGTVTLNGLPIAATPTCGADSRARLTFQELTEGHVVEAFIPCAGAASTYETMLPKGQYSVRIEGRRSNLPPVRWPVPGTVTVQ